jgi:hypothetical protein
MSRIYLVTLKDQPLPPVLGGFLVDANAPSQALTAIAKGCLDIEIADGKAVAGMIKAGAKIIEALATEEQLPLPPSGDPEQVFDESRVVDDVALAEAMEKMR